MAEKEIFNTVLRGYKKEQVTAYIEQMNDQLQDLKYSFGRKEVEIDRLNKEITSLKKSAQKVDVQEIEDEIRQKIEQELHAEYDAKLSEEIAKIKEETSKVSEDSDAARKAKEYDECKDALAELMIQARRSADEIVLKANSEARLIRTKTEAEFSKLGVDFSVLQQNVGTIKGELRQSLDKIADQMDLFEERLYSIQNDVDHMLDSLTAEEQQN